jgi:hypothetical protein
VDASRGTTPVTAAGRFSSAVSLKAEGKEKFYCAWPLKELRRQTPVEIIVSILATRKFTAF